jgi:cysteate synthase
LFDALEATHGSVVSVTNEELREACELFERVEGIDIMAEGGVALASLIKEAREGRVERDAIVMLNITGGGEKRFKEGRKIHRPTPELVIGPDRPTQEILAAAEKLLDK